MTAAIVPVAELSPHLPARGALIGLDLGTKTIGVAASDPDRRVAAGVETVARTRCPADAGRLLALAAERKAAGFVLGPPSTWTAARAPARNRPGPSPATWRGSRNSPSPCGTSASPPPRSSANSSPPLPAVQGGDRPACRDLHPAGRAGPAAAGPTPSRYFRRVGEAVHGLTTRHPPAARDPLPDPKTPSTRFKGRENSRGLQTRPCRGRRVRLLVPL
jgi:hypothetical protein